MSLSMIGITLSKMEQRHCLLPLVLVGPKDKAEKLKLFPAVVLVTAEVEWSLNGHGIIMIHVSGSWLHNSFQFDIIFIGDCLHNDAYIG